MGTMRISDEGLERDGISLGWVGCFSGDHESTAALPPCLLSCQVADSEVKAGTLQLTVDRLSGTLAKMEESEGALRDKVQGLTEALAQNSASLTSTQDKNLQLQKALKACEHDRQVLQVRGVRVCLVVDPVRELVNRAGLEGLVESQPMGS